MVRQYDVTREEVARAWTSVQASEGCAGCDGQSIDKIRGDLDNQLYKIWNRMSSGSYIPSPVKLVEIPKAKGGVRVLGVPTVADRIAQSVIKERLEAVLEKQFHPSSYGYRPNRSPIDAVAVCRQRCFEHEWLVEFDIKGFFDNLDHDLCMEMLKRYTEDQTVLLYALKFLKAKGLRSNGEEVSRDRGASQGGVISPILSNLYLHEALDKWMAETHPTIKFERFADDWVVHCVSEKQAYYIKSRIEGRLKQFKLELHPDKTKVIYTGSSNKHDARGHKLLRKFTFLGYDFKPRFVKGRLIFSPGMGRGALKRTLEKIKTEWHLNQMIGEELIEVARRVNPVIRGWLNYYGHFRRSDLYKLGRQIDQRLAIFLKKKHKVIRTWNQAWKALGLNKELYPKMFCHWHMICQTRRAG
jgi:RNA-directed DNA polymerase